MEPRSATNSEPQASRAVAQAREALDTGRPALARDVLVAYDCDGASEVCLNGRTGVVGETGWITVECQHCHRIWQGGDTYLQDLPGGAVDGAVHLGQVPHRGG